MLDEALAVRSDEPLARQVKLPRRLVLLLQVRLEQRKLAVPPRNNPPRPKRPICGELMHLDQVQLEALAVRLSDGRPRDRDVRSTRDELGLVLLRLELGLLELERAHLAPQALARLNEDLELRRHARQLGLANEGSDDGFLVPKLLERRCQSRDLDGKLKVARRGEADALRVKVGLEVLRFEVVHILVVVEDSLPAPLFLGNPRRGGRVFSLSSSRRTRSPDLLRSLIDGRLSPSNKLLRARQRRRRSMRRHSRVRRQDRVQRLLDRLDRLYLDVIVVLEPHARRSLASRPFVFEERGAVGADFSGGRHEKVERVGEGSRASFGGRESHAVEGADRGRARGRTVKEYSSVGACTTCCRTLVEDGLEGDLRWSGFCALECERLGRADERWGEGRRCWRRWRDRSDKEGESGGRGAGIGVGARSRSGGGRE